MGDYKSGYDPKYGYNRNAFAHKTIPQAIIGRTVKLIATPLGLVSESLHNQKEKKKRSESQPDVLSTAGPKVPAPNEKPQDKEKPSKVGESGDDPSPVYIEVSDDQANELIATSQAVPADGETATHELIPEETEDDGVDRDEAD